MTQRAFDGAALLRVPLTEQLTGATAGDSEQFQSVISAEWALGQESGLGVQTDPRSESSSAVSPVCL